MFDICMASYAAIGLPANILATWFRTTSMLASDIIGKRIAWIYRCRFRHEFQRRSACILGPRAPTVNVGSVTRIGGRDIASALYGSIFIARSK
jgi:hypothetical protein